MSWRNAILVLALVAVSGCATNPVSGKREFTLVSSGQELQMGREAYGAVIAEFGLYPDSALQTYVNTVGQRVAKVSHLPNLEWHFTVIDDPAVNAFAMPGGYIYITRGILAHLNSEAQLAGVLGHEIGHVTARHSAQRMTQQQLAGIGVGLAAIFSPGFQRYSEAAQQALGLMFLKYGRDDENQADELGVQYALAGGYDPREIPATYGLLQRISERSGQRLPSYLSTHPDPGQRQERTRALASQAAANKTGLLVRGNDYVRRQDGVVFGADPRQGYFEQSHYYHPSLGFEIVFPTGWKTADSRAAIIAAAPQDRAAIQMSIAARTTQTPAGLVANLVQSGKIANAVGDAETIHGKSAWVGRLILQPDAQGVQGILTAGFVRWSPDIMFQILGKSGQPNDADGVQIVAAIRSLSTLSDPARAQPQPDRVKVVQAPRNGEFQAVVPALGQQAASLEDTAILNNLFLDQEVRTGELLKIVAAGRRR